MKRYMVALMGLSVLGTSLPSCKKITDLSPISSVSSPGYWKTPDQVLAFVNGLHISLRSSNSNLMSLGELRSDIYGTEPKSGTAFTGEATQGLENMWNQTLSQNNAGVNNYADFYININQINLLISKIGDVPGISDADKQSYLGMAYGMRSFYYFQIYKTWGDAIIVTDPYENFDISKLNKENAPAADVMKQIKADIDASNQAFGTEYALKPDYGYWSKAATQMLKAEVYLWTAHRDGGSADATIAKTALIETQAGVPSLALQSSFSDVFSVKGNKEIILASKYMLNEANMNFITSSFVPQTSLIGNYYKANGAKYSANTDNWGGVLRAPIRTATFKKFNATDMRRAATIGDAYNKDEATGELKLVGCFLSKFQGVQNAGVRAYVNDYPIYRYADLILMLAEAKSILGEDFSAEINSIRQRAYGANYNPATMAYPLMLGDELADKNEVILNERLFEFIGEGKRWSDLRRFGDKYVLAHTSLLEVGKLLWPIDLNTLTNNRLLKQTQGY